jgi:hypothetical protein
VNVGWTGHRPELFQDSAAARSAVLEQAARLLKRSGNVRFITGGQRGVDLWAAQCALAARIPFEVILPVKPAAFTRDWLPEDVAALDALLEQAESVTTVDMAGRWEPLAYDLRCEEIARRADLLVVVWTGTRQGGTFLTICAAEARGIPIQQATMARSSGPLSGRGI